jgi:hypothetical protein
MPRTSKIFNWVCYLWSWSQVSIRLSRVSSWSIRPVNPLHIKLQVPHVLFTNAPPPWLFLPVCIGPGLLLLYSVSTFHSSNEWVALSGSLHLVSRSPTRSLTYRTPNCNSLAILLYCVCVSETSPYTLPPAVNRHLICNSTPHLLVNPLIPNQFYNSVKGPFTMHTH